MEEVYTITPDEFNINEEIKNDEDIKAHYRQLKILEDPEEYPILAFTLYSIDRFKNLCEILEFHGTKGEFAINALLYYLQQKSYYTKAQLDPRSMDEIIQQDVLDLYESYNKKCNLTRMLQVEGIF